MLPTFTRDRLNAVSLTEDGRARTCGYWYCVDSYGTPQTAFRTRAAFAQWLDLFCLSLSQEIPPEGEYAILRIVGSYRETLHMDRTTWEALDGMRIMALSNGNYTEARLVPDPDGIICAHILNPNVRDRPTFDYRQASARVDAGRADFLLQPLEPA